MWCSTSTRGRRRRSSSARRSGCGYARCSSTSGSRRPPRPRAPRACRSTSRSTRRRPTPRPSRSPSASRRCSSGGTPSLVVSDMKKEPAHGQGARRLEPERRAQDDGQRLLVARPRAADGLDPAALGGGRGGARSGDPEELAFTSDTCSPASLSTETCSARSSSSSRSCRFFPPRPEHSIPHLRKSSFGVLTEASGMREGRPGVRTGSLESLREFNRLRVVEALRGHGTASRAEIARITGLSRSTVSSLVADLQSAGSWSSAPTPTPRPAWPPAARRAAVAGPFRRHRRRHRLRPRPCPRGGLGSLAHRPRRGDPPGGRRPRRRGLARRRRRAGQRAARGDRARPRRRDRRRHRALRPDRPRPRRSAADRDPARLGGPRDRGGDEPAPRRPARPPRQRRQPRRARRGHARRRPATPATRST